MANFCGSCLEGFLADGHISIFVKVVDYIFSQLGYYLYSFYEDIIRHVLRCMTLIGRRSFFIYGDTAKGIITYCSQRRVF